MKITPTAAPQAPQAQGQSSRDKAIAAFMNPTTPTQQAAVQNQNAIAPEETVNNPAATGQTDTVESPPEAKAETPEQQQISRQFAQLARQEKALRQKALEQDRALKAREEALKAKESQEPDYSNYISKDLFKKDPLAALQAVGLSYDQITEQILNPGLDPRVEQHISNLEAKIKAFEEKFGNLEKTAQERETQAYNAALMQIEKDTKALVDSDDTYEMIKVTKSYKDVVDLIKQTFDKDGTLLSVEEAAQAVEDYLVEEAEKLSKTNKIKNKLAQSVAPSKPAEQPPAQPQKPQMKTLTNATSSSRQLSARERAIMAFQGTLKT